MSKKHPTLGKRNLAERYFLRPNTIVDPESTTEDSPVPAKFPTEDGYLRMKNYKWVFHGKSETKARYSDKKETRTAFLLNPVGCAPIVAAIRHSIPEDLKAINAFDDPVMVDKLIRMKLNLSLISSPKTPTLKEKLFKTQKGQCFLCDKLIDYDYLHYNSVHIHHIQSIKSGGTKFALKNLALTHS